MIQKKVRSEIDFMLKPSKYIMRSMIFKKNNNFIWFLKIIIIVSD